MKYGSRTAVMQNVPLPPSDQQFVSCAELARYLGVSPQTARKAGEAAGAVMRLGSRNTRFDLQRIKSFYGQTE